MKSEIVNKLIELGFLVSPDFVDFINDDVLELIKKKSKSDGPIVLNADLWKVIKDKDLPGLNWLEFDRARVIYEKGRDGKVYSSFLDMMSVKKEIVILDGVQDLENLEQTIEQRIIGQTKQKDLVTGNVTVLKSCDVQGKKRDLSDFVCFFKSRYESLSQILQSRENLKNIVSINKLYNRKDKDPISVIGIVFEKRLTKNGHFIIKIEDLTGPIDILINKDNKELVEICNDLVLDEVIGVNGVMGDRIIYSKEIIYPDVSISNEFKKINEDVHVVFTADLHIGSKDFYKEDFLKFIDWLNCKGGNEQQKEVASKVKYLFIVGDLVDGIGIYPGQEDELGIVDVCEQYNECYELLNLIRKDVQIIICAGNHDAVRLAEPQPVLDKKYAGKLYELTNATFVTNPSIVNINSTSNFIGFNILLYHGYSFIYYGNNVNSIRVNGGVSRPDLIMKFLLQRRHLAPTHASTMYVPDDKDYLVIDKVPDFFVSGHLHKTSVTNYRNVTMIGCGCWVGQTPYQAKFGVIPDPSRISLVNLKTRDVKILKFGGK